MLGDNSLNHRYAWNTRLSPAVLCMGGQRPEFIKLIFHDGI